MGQQQLDTIQLYRGNCIFRLTTLLLLDLVLMMGWILAAEKVLPTYGWMVFFFPLCFYVQISQDIENWGLSVIATGRWQIIDMLPGMGWLTIVPYFPHEAILFLLLQSIHFSLRRRWECSYALYHPLKENNGKSYSHRFR